MKSKRNIDIVYKNVVSGVKQSLIETYRFQLTPEEIEVKIQTLMQVLACYFVYNV